MFVVMSGKAKADCGAVFRTVLDQLPSVPTVDSITADFEVATWKPGINKRATEGLCFSFYANSVAQVPRTWHADSVQLENEHRRLMVIPFLSAAYISSIFGIIEATDLPKPPSQLLTYFKRQWMTNSIFSISS